jgi:ABC-2 type transport system ATP-binding protein
LAVKSKSKPLPKSAIEYCIEVEDLVKSYGKVRAVDGISIRVRKGEVFAFLGPNGAGKTTTVEIIESIRTPDSGRIRIMGLDPAVETEAFKRVVGVLPQEFSSFDKLTVRETLEFYASLYEKRADIDGLIRLMDLGEHRDRLYDQLSGGLKRRVGIAVALVNEPEVVFLDEPTTGLDPQARRDVWKVLSDLKKKGRTIFLTTHYMEEAEELADHVAVINHGKIIAEGTVDGLIAEHGSGFTLTFRGVGKGFDEALIDLGLSSDAHEGARCIGLKDKEGLLRVLGEIQARKLEYKEFSVRRPSLEEVFLALTGERLEGGGEK